MSFIFCERKILSNVLVVSEQSRLEFLAQNVPPRPTVG